ncbi:hypothetical protein QJS04_geneDACA015712 [Acorus gramineus]|uniref:Uncharacterized protein n=1 Tax=Acorus gramineus TaxID=55184 RepID=A0AAV9AMX4_ACOGR|nr:hypothetical protein QJS04_geneDACA015712 [Acorus gramineus]
MLGVFEMSQIGLQAVSNPSEIFLSEHHSDSHILSGLAVAVVLDGYRTFLVEIQALCVSGSTGIRNVNGVKESKADLIIAVLMKQAGIKLQDNIKCCSLQAVSNPSEIFLSEHHSDSHILSGLAVAVVLDGYRTFLVEIQALCVSESPGRRNVNGVKERKANLIVAV